MNQSALLHLVVLYDANHNQYSLLAHNQNQGDAERIVEEQTSTECSGASLIALDQHKRHRIEDPESCRAYREIVENQAHFSPKPQFTRRNAP